jgi:pimeloyl-ACP methyl ester carboxylesterase
MAISAEMAQRYPDDPAAAATAMFYGFTPPDVATAAIARLRPQPPQVVSAPLSISDDRFGRIPRAYIECENDAIVPLAVQRRMQARLPSHPVITMPGDHSPFLSAPVALAAHIQEVLGTWNNR